MFLPRRVTGGNIDAIDSSSVDDSGVANSVSGRGDGEIEVVRRARRVFVTRTEVVLVVVVCFLEERVAGGIGTASDASPS